MRGAEGPSLDPAGDLFVNTRSQPCPHSGVWRIAGRTATVADQVVPPFTSWGGGTAFLRAGPFAGHLVAVDEASHRVVRAVPPSFGTPVDFSGCAVSPARYCPTDPVTRGQMAVFLVKTFNLPL